ncbi:hypothetical protein [Zobellia galactanivorans]|uniref:hypothetical protein n=1 Tax=Zobellia galactanivorans (strain DSM 12802 / CCUG 47099 / CIP 106680 / NCIMB 13871 / Dsij) TaxID=63186 RepID=UPI001C07A306|nr:hypothetical protein [Zobellia galactanivorans]MBU3024181.1 hypothetical protein [Zobellia galactanivorans]
MNQTTTSPFPSRNLILFWVLLMPFWPVSAQNKVSAGADERTPSKAQYFSWINNTNEGAAAEQTRINLEFFGWLKKEYGMQLDIYAMDAGAIDGKNFYGSIYSDRFKTQFPNGFDPIYAQAKSLDIRLGVWGGPDGFGDTPEEEKARTDQMVKLCKDYNFALFKFDAVCGPLRPEKEDAFINMMQQCRVHSPDLILLNHRIGLDKAAPYATTFLWEGHETYIDVHMTNNVTAPHHRASALSRGLVPGLQRLTEDHGVCISSCLDYWEDDLILQAFNRELILSPEIYGNPWLLNENEFSKLAHIYNIHKKYRDILVDGKVADESYGPNAVTRGNGKTQLISLRNLKWEAATYAIQLDEEIGLKGDGSITLLQLHPTEKMIGTFSKGESIPVEVLPFRSALFLATTQAYDAPLIAGANFQTVKNVDDAPIEIELLGMPGTTSNIQLQNENQYTSAEINGKKVQRLVKGKKLKLNFPGNKLRNNFHRKLSPFTETAIPEDVESIYEATVFAADNNALEVRSLQRSGATLIPEVKAARDAFFNQKAFVNRGVWDKNLFDGNLKTGFWPSRKFRLDPRVDGGSLRLDLGEVTYMDKLIITVPDEFSLQPLLVAEGNFVEVSTNLVHWEEITYLAATQIEISLNKKVRYLRFKNFPQRIVEIEGLANGKKLDRSLWKASNLFAHSSKKIAKKVWKSKIVLDEIADGSYLCVALNGKHGIEGAYAGAKIGENYIGANDRASSFPSNTWEFLNSRRDTNYTYYIPLDKNMVGKEIDVFVMGYDKANLSFDPELWITAYPHPWKKIKLILNKK